MEEATERGRDELRPEIARLEEELSRTQSLAANSRASERVLYKRLTQAPDELTAAAQQLTVGTPGCQLILATCWSRMDVHDRCKAIPIIATQVAGDVDRLIATLRVKDAMGDRIPELLDRLEWLTDALTTESGRSYAIADRTRRPEWAPLEASRRKAVEWLLRCRQVIHEGEATAQVTDVGEMPTPEPRAITTEVREAIAAEARAAMTTEVREAIATTVNDAVASHARAAIEIEADRMRGVARLVTAINERAEAIATKADPTRPSENGGAAGTNITPAAEAGFNASAASVSNAGGVGLPAPSELGARNQPGAVWRVPLGVTTGHAPRPTSPDGYFDAAGRRHDWPTSAGADDANPAR
jgi:hypothetical protein